ncbi:MAG: hypothetical protein U1E88_00120 [Acinetobacter sp.]
MDILGFFYRPVIPATVKELSADGAASAVRESAGDRIVAIDNVVMKDWFEG